MIDTGTSGFASPPPCGGKSRYSDEFPPPDVFDPVIEHYKKDVDRTILRENLKLTTQERSERFERMMEVFFELQRQAAERRERRGAPP